MENKERIRKHIYVSGRVQGVGFRYSISYIAQNMGVTGWAENLDDGRVELELQGTREELDLVFRKLERNKFVCITDYKVETIPVITENSFLVRG